MDRRCAEGGCGQDEGVLEETEGRQKRVSRYRMPLRTPE
jgi:hypothetical protein